MQQLSSSISSPSLGLESSRKYVRSTNICQKQQVQFRRATINASQEAAHSKLNKTKLKDHVINFQQRQPVGTPKNDSSRLMAESKFSISPRLNSNESFEDFALRSKSSIKRFARTEKSRSTPKYSLVSREEYKKQQKLTNPQSNLGIVYNKASELVNPETNDFKLYQGIIKKLRSEKTILYQKNSELNIEKLKFMDQIKSQNQKIKDLTTKLLIKTESFNIDQAKKIINSQLNGKQEGQDQVLKLRKELKIKTQKIEFLNDKIIKLEANIRSLTEKQKIESLKTISERKKMTLEKQQALAAKDMEIKTLKSKVPALEMKLKTVMKEIEQKDRFIKNYLMNKTSDKETKEYICEVLEKFKELFIDELRFAEKIVELQQKIQEYQ